MIQWEGYNIWVVSNNALTIRSLKHYAPQDKDLVHFGNTE